MATKQPQEPFKLHTLNMAGNDKEHWRRQLFLDDFLLRGVKAMEYKHEAGDMPVVKLELYIKDIETIIPRGDVRASEESSFLDRVKRKVRETWDGK